MPEVARAATRRPNFRFQSELFFNLHHTLYYQAQVLRKVAGHEHLTPIDEAAYADARGMTGRRWRQAVEIYRKKYAKLDFVFSDALVNDDNTLARIGPGDSIPASVPAAMREALTLARPEYEARLWPKHHAAGRSFIDDLKENLAPWKAAFATRLAKLYQTPWLAGPYIVNAVAYGSWAGSYCNTATGFTNIVMSTSDADEHALSGVDVLFHEASHSIVDPFTGPIARAIDRGSAKFGKKPPDNFWHALIMYTPGKLAEQWFSKPGKPYTMVWIREGLFTKVWPSYYKAFEAHWWPYMQGRISMEPAIAACLRQVFDSWGCPDH